jgi:hypothetical protein
MPTFDDLQTRYQDLIRKGLQGSVFVKRYVEGDAEITALTDATGLLAIPTGYTDVGFLTKDQGVEWTRDVSTSDVESHGSAEPTRRDVTGDVSGLQFTMQESGRQAFELYEGQDLGGVTYDANGNVSWDKPDRPASIYYRVFVLFKDGDGVDAKYFAKWLPRAQVTDRGSQSWNENDELQYAVTLTAFNDPEVGTSQRTLWSAPATTLGRMGFTAATP